MSGPPDRTEAHTLRGPTDRSALITARDVVEEMEPLATPRLDDVIDPSVLTIALEDGLCKADEARIDVRWTTRDDYSIHYTDSAGVNCRWDAHPHGGDYVHASGIEHYHPPPDASSDPHAVEASAIEQTTTVLVARAVLKLWRTADHAESLDRLNAASNPP